MQQQEGSIMSEAAQTARVTPTPSIDRDFLLSNQIFHDLIDTAGNDVESYFCEPESQYPLTVDGLNTLAAGSGSSNVNTSMPSRVSSTLSSSAHRSYYIHANRA